jgi:histidine triad (HIT) family protein
VAACVFCAIVADPSRAEVVYEDGHVLAFLDHRPLFPGHVLVVPRAHHVTLPDLPDELLLPVVAASRLLASAVEKGLGAEGTFMAINNKVSQSVPHLHVHVIPRRKGDGLRGFFWPRVGYTSPAHLHETRDKIRAEAARLSARA